MRSKVRPYLSWDPPQTLRLGQVTQVDLRHRAYVTPNQTFAGSKSPFLLEEEG